MIAGLRGLPWLQHKSRQEPHTVKHLVDCNSCKATYAPELRQAMACGYEPLIPFGRTWWPPPDDLSGEPPEICIGYLIRLPLVQEVSSGYRHWAKGTLAAKLEGEQPTQGYLAGLEVLDHSVSELEAAAMRPAKGNS